MADTIFILHRFTTIKDGITLSDALVMPKTEYDSLTPVQIESLKEERFVNHKERIEHPPVQPELSKAELIDFCSKLNSLLISNISSSDFPTLTA